MLRLVKDYTDNAYVNNEKIHTLEWRIKNFSSCNIQFGKKLESPTSIAGNLFHTRWTVLIYPKGKYDPNFLSCYLRRETENVGPKKMRVACAFSMVTFDGVEAHTKRGIQEYERLVTTGFSEFRKLADIFCDKELFLQSDTLTIRCTLRMLGPKSKTSEQIFRPKFPLQKFTMCLHLDSFRGSTKQNPQIFEILPSESSANLLSLNVSMNRDETSENQIQEATIGGQNPEATVQGQNPETTVGGQNPEATVEGRNLEARESFLHMVMTKKEECYSIHISCFIQVLNKNFEVAQVNKEISHLFSKTDEEEEWILPYFIDTANLPHDCIEDDRLLLNVDITICDSEEFEEVTNTTPLKLRAESRESTLMKELEYLHEKSVFTDVILLVEGKAFPAHKFILASRSQRFGEIFTSAAKEKTSRRQYIQVIVDVDKNTMALLLKFIYTDTLEDMSCEMCSLLYSAAQKYQISSLRFKCVEFSKRKLSVRYAYIALEMAEEWHDTDLKIVALDRFVEHCEYIFLTPKWQTFEEEHEELANQVLRHVRFKKLQQSES